MWKNLLITNLSCFLLLFTSIAQADWTWNIGYHNPPNSTIGVNFEYFWSKWALELGAGFLDFGTKDRSNTATLYLAGDVNMKYLFLSGVFRPYLMGGLGLGSGTSVGDNTALGASAGGGFVGGGVLMRGHPVYAYLGLAIGNASTFQFGVGFDF